MYFFCLKALKATMFIEISIWTTVSCTCCVFSTPHRQTHVFQYRYVFSLSLSSNSKIPYSSLIRWFCLYYLELLSKRIYILDLFTSSHVLDRCDSQRLLPIFYLSAIIRLNIFATIKYQATSPFPLRSYFVQQCSSAKIWHWIFVHMNLLDYWTQF